MSTIGRRPSDLASTACIDVWNRHTTRWYSIHDIVVWLVGVLFEFTLGSGRELEWQLYKGGHINNLVAVQ